MAKFDNAKIGDNVWSSKKGWGKITKIDNSKVYDLLEVTFLISSNYDIEKITYTFDGRESLLDLYPTLFWNEVKLPTEKEDKKPFDLVEFLRENLKPKEFEYGKRNRYISYEYDLKEFEYCVDYHSEDIGTVYIEELDDYPKTISELTINEVTPQQLKQAYKELGWL